MPQSPRRRRCCASTAWSSTSRCSAGCSVARRGMVRAVDGVSFDVARRRDARAGRRIRLRQVDDRPAGAAPDRADGGSRAVRRRRHLPRCRRTRCARCAGAADHLPGSVRVAQSAHDRRARRWRSRSRCTASREGRRRERVAEMLDLVGLALAVRAPLSARVLGRAAAAHRHRARARGRAAAHRLRRAGVRARRVDPGAGRSTCCATCRRGSGSPTSSSRTTSRS